MQLKMQKAIEIIDDAVKQIHENDNKTRHLMEFKDGTCVKAHPDAFNNDIGINICKDICKDTECFSDYRRWFIFRSVYIFSY